VGSVVGSGVFVTLDAPFVDVLVRVEELGTERYKIDDEGLRAVAERSGDVISLGDRMLVEIIDVSITRRSVYARRVGGGSSKERFGKKKEPRLPSKKTLRELRGGKASKKGGGRKGGRGR
jgi:ribonuclease R